MMETQNYFEKAADVMDNTKTKTAYVLNAFIDYLLLGLILIGTVMFSIFMPGFNTSIGSSFWLMTSIIVVLGSITMVVFIIRGRDAERKRNGGYRTNCEKWAKMSQSIQEKNSLKFSQHCAQKTIEKKERKFRSFLENANVSLEEFAEYEKMSVEELKKYARQRDIIGERKVWWSKKKQPVRGFRKIPRKKLKWILKAKAPIKVHQIVDVVVLMGTKAQNGHEVGHDSGQFQTAKTVVMRNILLTLWLIATAMLILNPYGDTGVLEWLGQTFMRLLQVVSSAAMGFYEGMRQIRYRNEVIKENIFFLNQFLEGEAKPVETPAPAPEAVQ